MFANFKKKVQTNALGGKLASMGAPGDKSGVLYVVATPIGNLEDVTLRALRLLKEVDLIACEDTRRTRKLLSYYDLHTPLTSYFEGNRLSKSAYIISCLREGRQVALVTEAGTPGISDPGHHLVALAAKEGFPVVPVPGPSALAAALSVSGLPVGRFYFHGFLPVKGRRGVLKRLKDLKVPLLFYESPRRLSVTLKDMLDVLGDRFVVLTRELTKIFEEVRRDRISVLLQDMTPSSVRGEITLVVFPEEKG